MNLLQPLHLPPYPFKLTEQNEQLFIYDEIRKKNLVLTPEEWVRQHFVQYLIREKKYPKALIKLEGGLQVHGRPRRSDIVVFNSDGQKTLMVECKAPAVEITQKVFDQIARYNITHQAPLLAVTNGLQHYYCLIDVPNKTYKFVQELPSYEG
ncbi:type I restriction enzyme HsdR N-terminal domain-containing protein [Mucilaginibacter robiniae]|uniref:Type I restriction enzyme HsdR N-terminal domain-containing protein n=1 Tax=Mucilaginibacter robiniae TaxID=2728022 RepID=A0A7L5DTM1_9SPHI|nr:type I restriction enzyme HsdR N-terminal domain-containing protein [Mucilaginibacter robiniae]QJD94455.1 type I restriction enzyme HsdR N-terminal domain-containing protein [Mucilaginibacter robiniae]